MEYSDGESLKSYLKGRKVVDYELINSYFTQILTGLHFLHKNSVIHNNLKPSNILIENHKEIKLTDFGIYFKSNLIKRKEKKINNHYSNSYHEKNCLYLSPEKEHKNVFSEKTDIYALGIILYEMINISEDQHSRIEKIKLLKKSQFLSEELKSNYPVYCDLITKMINNDPEKRPSILEITNSKFSL